MKRIAAAGACLACAYIATHAVQYGIFTVSWIVLGNATLDGRLGITAVAGWLLCQVAALGCRLATVHLQAALTVRLGGALRRRLLDGASALEPSLVRRQGTGHLLGRILEVETIEDVAVGASLTGIAATVELAIAAALLGAVLGPVPVGMLMVWSGVALALALRYVRRRERWTAARVALGYDLTEKMAGHRTRTSQQSPSRWHDGEEESLAAYVRDGRAMDRWLVALTVLPRTWALAGLTTLALAAVSGATRESLVAGAAGVLFTTATMARMTTGLATLGEAHAAWREVRPLTSDAKPIRAVVAKPPADPAARLIHADSVGYRYPGRPETVLSDCSLTIDTGDRVLIQGTSGGGKSTLVGLLAGLRQPTTGEVTLRGARTVDVDDDEWRKRVAAVPQWHENHLIAGPLALNLLMGQRWPPEPADLDEAYQVCLTLGLGGLLDRMPSGLQQMVGETGWRLSQGERSMVFLGRALLQNAEAVILDETFGALDPPTLATALAAARTKAPTLVVIAQ
jgi:ATP-binding cassette subfamily B protein